MKYIMFVALGGAGGAVARYLLANWLHAAWETRIPWGTLSVNVLGSALIGILFVLIDKNVLHPDWRGVLMVGFLGAFTTFSTFSLETIHLIEQGLPLWALGYIASSVLLCVTAAGLTVYVGRLFVS